MDIKQKRIEIFEDTLKLINTNNTILNETKKAYKTMKIYSGNENILKEKCDKLANISVINSRTFSAINSFKKTEKTAVLNFASATNPGGGVKRGSGAQEECLCRSSNLFQILNSKSALEKYYGVNRSLHDSKYTDTIIYIPDIIVFKTDEEFPVLMDESKWFKTDVITCPAPCLINITLKATELLEIHKRRARKILTSAINNDVKNIVLGAFGCGAFRNDPEIVARAYKEILIDEEYAKYFDEIIFAVYCNKNDLKNFNIFSRIFKKYN